MAFSNLAVVDIKNQVNIVDVISRVVPLKKAGTNFKGVCPFHNEKTPSFVVSEEKQIFTCFGCGAKGDAIEFVKKYYNLDFNEAIEKIAAEYGITIEKSAYNENKEIYYELNRQAASFFYKAFTEKANYGYTYMKNRGIEDSVLKKFGIGYADESWDSLYKYFKEINADMSLAIELGLISESKGKYYDKYRNRVIFPIINTSGKVIGFGGRAIGDDNPKYINSSESKIFQKKNNLYGLNISRQEISKEGQAILVEGYMDLIGLSQYGIRNVVASLGTSLTENQAKLLKRYTKEVILSYDADEAGRTAAMRGLDVLNKVDCKVKVLHVTEGKDPDEFIRKNGKASFLSLVESALPYGDYKLESIKKGFDFSKDEDKIDYIKKATDILKELRPVEADVYIQKLAKELKISEGAIRMEIFDKDPNENIHNIRIKDEHLIQVREINVLEKNLIKIMLTNDDYIDLVREKSEMLVSDFSNKIFDIILDEYKKDGILDIKKIMDVLEPEECLYLQGIIDDVLTGGKEEQIYNECVKSFEFNKLVKEEKKLIKLLSIADEEKNTDNIKYLTDKLIEVQQNRKNNRGKF